MLGNDIVDFSLDEKKYLNHKFINRILNQFEQELLAKIKPKNALLWTLWSAKEASYKALQKLNHQLIFSPVNTGLTIEALDQLQIQIEETDKFHSFSLTNRIETENIKLTFEYPDLYTVHCSALIMNKNYSVNNIQSKIVKTSDCLTYHQQSAAVRELAQNLITKNNLSAEILRPDIFVNGYKKPGPPILYSKDEGILSHEISLSHDNNWLAATLMVNP